MSGPLGLWAWDVIDGDWTALDGGGPRPRRYGESGMFALVYDDAVQYYVLDSTGERVQVGGPSR
jgi:hypothetical protein